MFEARPIRRGVVFSAGQCRDRTRAAERFDYLFRGGEFGHADRHIPKVLGLEAPK